MHVPLNRWFLLRQPVNIPDWLQFKKSPKKIPDESAKVEIQKYMGIADDLKTKCLQRLHEPTTTKK